VQRVRQGAQQGQGLPREEVRARDEGLIMKS